MTIYAVGDIHGHRSLLDEAIVRIEADGGAQAEVVFLGDYVDRGPDSRGVIDRLMEGVAAGKNWTCIAGNHDRMFCNFVQNGVVYDPNIGSGLGWTHQRLGGGATLASYGVEMDGKSDEDLYDAAQQAVPEAHLDFLMSRPLYHERDGYLFVHAGIRPGVPLAEQSDTDLIWIRDAFLPYSDPFDWLVVHGHTAVQQIENHGNRINMDGGAGYGRPLRIAALEQGRVFDISFGERVEVPLFAPDRQVSWWKRLFGG